MRKRLERLLPPGAGLWDEWKLYGVYALFLLVGVSFGFLFAYGNAKSYLYEWVYGKQVLIPGAKMPLFSTLMRHRLVGYWGYVLGCVGAAAGHYRSFYTPSSSIYVMRRLPDAGELHRRCWGMPLLAMAAGAVLAVVLTVLYWLVYRFATPAECLPENTISDIWRALL